MNPLISEFPHSLPLDSQHEHEHTKFISTMYIPQLLRKIHLDACILHTHKSSTHHPIKDRIHLARNSVEKREG